jgi:hypothetical protein
MRVLFVGNSHTYFNDMPALFARMCRELTGETPEVTMLAYSGRSLAWHREEYFALRFALLRGGFDYCVIQQQAHPFPGEAATEAGLRAILPLCERGGARPVLFMTWAEKARPENAAPMARCYRRLAEESGALLAPVGELFEGFRGTDVELYWRDGEHASPYGSYLTAATLAALLCGTAALDALTDAGFDFRAEYDKGSGEPPRAEEDLARAEIALDPAKTARIRAAVAAALAG